jgi:hypothetical protein
MLLLLEDNRARIEAFTRVLRRALPELPITLWMDAHTMIRELDGHLAQARLISLDHDLYAAGDAPDPGDGLDVVKYLVTLNLPRPPVIVHSSNSDRAQMMMGELELVGWPCERVVPLGERWIEDDWLESVRRLCAAGPHTEQR